MNLKHGGGSAIKEIQHGLPLSGLAAEEERAVTVELEQSGIDAIQEKNAIRLQSVANLYWDAIQKCAAEGNLALLDGYVQRLGWLIGTASRQWLQVQANRDAALRGRKIGAGEVLDAITKEVSNDKDNG